MMSVCDGNVVISGLHDAKRDEVALFYLVAGGHVVGLEAFGSSRHESGIGMRNGGAADATSNTLLRYLCRESSAANCRYCG